MNSSENNNFEFTDLFIRYLIGEITPVELQILKDWINSSPENKAQFDKYEAAWLLSNKTNEVNKIDNSLLWHNLHSKIKTPLRLKNEDSINKSNRKLWLKIAASWIVFLALGSILTLWTSDKGDGSQNRITEIIVPLGAKSLIKLPDGTSVWLNSGSKLSYSSDFNKSDRKINLSGEAFFSVFTNKAKPFTVLTSDIIVRAFGTRFNVKAYPEEKTITATLEEGKIDVSLINGTKASSNPVVLTPNQKVVYFKSNNSLQEFSAMAEETEKESEKIAVITPLPTKMVVASNINTELYTSWKDNRWIIEGITFESLAPMLERRFNMKIQFRDEELKKYKFTGTVQNETVEQIMEALKFTAPMDFKIIRDSVML